MSNFSYTSTTEKDGKITYKSLRSGLNGKTEKIEKTFNSRAELDEYLKSNGLYQAQTFEIPEIDFSGLFNGFQHTLGDFGKSIFEEAFGRIPVRGTPWGELSPDNIVEKHKKALNEAKEVKRVADLEKENERHAEHTRKLEEKSAIRKSIVELESLEKEFKALGNDEAALKVREDIDSLSKKVS